MKNPLQITYRDIEPTPSIDEAIRSRVAWLEGYYPDIVSCRVVVEMPHRRRHTGGLYRVRIDMTVPGAELVVGRHPTECEEHRDFYVALRDAFHAARRELEDYARKRRQQVKRHAEPGRGHVTGLFRDRGFGFLRTPDDREVYFHENSVVGGMDALELGTKVQFSEEPGEKGPQAVVVKRVGPRSRSS